MNTITTCENKTVFCFVSFHFVRCFFVESVVLCVVKMYKNGSKRIKFLPYLPPAPKNRVKEKTKLPKVKAEDLRMAYAQMNMLSEMVNQHIPMLELEVQRKTSENEKLLVACKEKERKLLSMMKSDAAKQNELMLTIDSLQNEIAKLKRSTTDKANEKLLAVCQEKEQKLLAMMKSNAAKQNELMSTIDSLRNEIAQLKKNDEKHTTDLPQQ